MYKFDEQALRKGIQFGLGSQGIWTPELEDVMFNEITDQALRKTDVSGSDLRYNGGKLRWSLVDFDALEDMVKVLDFWAKKYADNNWKKGLKTTEIFESMMRHMTAYIRGEDIDLESGLPHTGHILCNAMFLSYMHRFKPEFDTRHKDKNKRCCGQWNKNGVCTCP